MNTHFIYKKIKEKHIILAYIIGDVQFNPVKYLSTDSECTEIDKVNKIHSHELGKAYIPSP